MDDAQMQTFYAGGLGLLVVAALMIAWLLWRMLDERRDAELAVLDGVSHEMRINLQRMMTEISQIAANPDMPTSALLPIKHPQLDGVNLAVIKSDRNALAVISATYQELIARKMDLQAALANGGSNLQAAMDDAMNASIDGAATLYMWEDHGGVRPGDAPSTRTWHVRDWMKENGFTQSMLPGMHLRDEVVERLREYGLELTPKPLTHTAAEYYAMQYDRQADPRGVFGKRRIKKKTVVDEYNEMKQDAEEEISDDLADAPEALEAVEAAIEDAGEEIASELTSDPSKTTVF